MALVKPTKTVAVHGATQNAVSLPKQSILDEDTYLKTVGNIIERDFFPDLKRLGLEQEYATAMESNDSEKLRSIQLQIERLNYKVQALSNTASTNLPDSSGIDKSEKESKDEDVRLDTFLAKNTSEDNASFETIMNNMKKKRRDKYAWLYEAGNQQLEREANVLAIEPGENGPAKALEYGTKIETWQYTPRNALMYVPDGAILSNEEIIEKSAKKERQICHENTRFQSNPFDTRSSQQALSNSSRDHAMMQKAVGKIGVDGNVEAPSATPKIGGYSLLAEPSPAPGVNESPMMTWGTIEGTPLRLDSTPSTLAASFKMPEPPKRETIGHRLAEEASKTHRDKRKAALTAAAHLSNKRKSGRQATAERITSLSSAAQRLIKSNIRRSSDRSLQAAYSPSPRRLTSPRSTPGSSRRTTPKTSSKSVVTPSSSRSATTPSLTDNLLDLP